MRPSRGARIIAGVGAAAALIIAGGCTSGAGGGDETLTVWTPHTSPDRLAVQEEVAAAFTEESGIDVEVVPMEGGDQDQALVTGTAAGDVPDVILHDSSQAGAWNSQGLLDTEVATATVDSLGQETFNDNALGAVTLDDEIVSVPSDGWTHVIAYRADLFEEAGVEEPTSVEELAEAATTIHDELGITGLAFGTQAGTASASEGIQSIFQSGGCELVEDGEITIDSAECTEAAEHFLALRDSSAAGDYDVESAQAAYLNGDAAMLLFSTHLLDELAGLDDSTPVTCAECSDDPMFLADNTEFITVLDEEHPAQYGAVLSYGVPVGANSEGAQQYIEYVMSDGYIDTLELAAEGRVPLRNGTSEDPTEYIDAWGDLGIGSEREHTTAELYGDEFVEQMGEGINAVHQWGMGTPDAELAGVVSRQVVLAGEIERLYQGESPEQTTSAMKASVEEVQAGL